MPRLPSFSNDPPSGLRETPADRLPPPASLPGRTDCRFFHRVVPTVHILPSPSVRPPVNPVRGTRFSALKSSPSVFWKPRRCIRHATCLPSPSSPNSSQAAPRSVNFAGRPAKVAVSRRRLPTWRCVVGSGQTCRRRGWNHGATGYRYRKRTRVRVACGVTIGPCGVGILSSHGHFGRSVDGSFLPPVVPLPVREESLRRGHLSRGSGLPAATLTGRTVGFVRLSAPADSMPWATRLRRAVVTRATFAPAQPAGTSGGWARRT